MVLGVYWWVLLVLCGSLCFLAVLGGSWNFIVSFCRFLIVLCGSL